VGIQSLAYAGLILYVLSGSISTLMFVEIIGGSAFFFLPSFILSIWALYEFLHSHEDRKIKKYMFRAFLLACIPLIVGMIGIVTGFILTILYPPGVN
jgi:hypothetical protein